MASHSPPAARRARRRPVASSDLERIEQALSDLTRITASARVHELRVRGSGVAISRTHLRFLAEVEELGPVSVSKLAARMDLSQPTASRALQQLESDGYVTRTGDPTDGRVACYAITDAGLRARGRVQAFMTKQLEGALRDLEPERRATTADVLTDLVARLSVSQPALSGSNDEGNP
jgi:DNA-binding MarR family transcriptional regulator